MLKHLSGTQRDLISHVALGHEAESVWMDALADIGKAIRLSANMPTGFLDIGPNVAVEYPTRYSRYIDYSTPTFLTPDGRHAGLMT